ncbi:hypothetical protein BLNAU_18311 [Blattamonas nauphoetae]|uniref:Uncharacterized protein n=1 Tax=Blattamonas nauphoetae TaxID=2049346 RepID=A0ABQ9X945_9EUKA|nr:hypothetical protein BLNAU_18311 [Blattamonas nauphoetae]
MLKVLSPTSHIHHFTPYRIIQMERILTIQAMITEKRPNGFVTILFPVFVILRKGNVSILDESVDSGLSLSAFPQTPSLTSIPIPTGKIDHHSRRLIVWDESRSSNNTARQLFRHPNHSLKHPRKHQNSIYPSLFVAHLTYTNSSRCSLTVLRANSTTSRLGSAFLSRRTLSPTSLRINAAYPRRSPTRSSHHWGCTTGWLCEAGCRRQQYHGSRPSLLRPIHPLSSRRDPLVDASNRPTRPRPSSPLLFHNIILKQIVLD